jgi:hypothetical protein
VGLPCSPPSFVFDGTVYSGGGLAIFQPLDKGGDPTRLRPFLSPAVLSALLLTLLLALLAFLLALLLLFLPTLLALLFALLFLLLAFLFAFLPAHSISSLRLVLASCAWPLYPAGTRPNPSAH